MKNSLLIGYLILVITIVIESRYNPHSGKNHRSGMWMRNNFPVSKSISSPRFGRPPIVRKLNTDNDNRNLVVNLRKSDTDAIIVDPKNGKDAKILDLNKSESNKKNDLENVEDKKNPEIEPKPTEQDFKNDNLAIIKSDSEDDNDAENVEDIKNPATENSEHNESEKEDTDEGKADEVKHSTHTTEIPSTITKNAGTTETVVFYTDGDTSTNSGPITESDSRTSMTTTNIPTTPAPVSTMSPSLDNRSTYTTEITSIITENSGKTENSTGGYTSTNNGPKTESNSSTSMTTTNIPSTPAPVPTTSPLLDNRSRRILLWLLNCRREQNNIHRHNLKAISPYHDYNRYNNYRNGKGYNGNPYNYY